MSGGASRIVASGIAANDASVAWLENGVFGLQLWELRTQLISWCRDASQAGASAWGSVGSPTVTTGQLGVDGTSSASRIQASTTQSRYFHVGGLSNSLVYSLSTWVRNTTGAQGTYQVVIGGGASKAEGGAVGPAFQRVGRALTSPGTGSIINAHACDGRDETSLGGVVAASRDVVIDFHQLELGSFPTPAIASSGAQVTRAGQRFYHATPATLVGGGCLSMSFALHAGAASNEYGSNMRLWTVDANNYAEVNASTRQLTVVIGGASATLASAAPMWSRNDLLEWSLVCGGGSLQTHAKVRVNGGTATDLGSSGAPQAAISFGGNAIDLLCNNNGGTPVNQFSGYVRRFAAFDPGLVEAWAA